MDSKEGQQTFLIFIAVLSFIYLIVNLIKCCTKNRNRVRNRPQPRRPPELPQPRRPPELPQVRKKQFIKQPSRKLNEESDEGFNTIPKEWRNLQ